MRTWISRNLIAISMTLALVPPLHAEQADSPVPQAEIDWALALEEKVKSGYKPIRAEVEAYQSLANRISRTQRLDPIPARDWSSWSLPFLRPSASVDFVLSKVERDWMQELMQRVQQNAYKPTEREAALYKQLFQRTEVAPK